MKVVSSVTVWSGAVGDRVSITYSDIDEATGKVLSDNNRLDRIITNQEAKEATATLKEYAQNLIDAE